jgi:hypothetical protein
MQSELGTAETKNAWVYGGVITFKKINHLKGI